MPEMAVSETEKTPVEFTLSVIPFWKRVHTEAMFFSKILHKTHIQQPMYYKDIQMNQREFHNALTFVRLITA